MDAKKKWCPGCQAEVDATLFPPNRARSDGLGSHCREHQKLHNNASWARHGAKRREMKAAYLRRVRQENRQRVLDYLAGRACEDCGETDAVVLEFHHRNPREKLAAVATLVSQGQPWPVILAEIAKCAVVCANDHRRREARGGGHYKVRLRPKGAVGEHPVRDAGDVGLAEGSLVDVQGADPLRRAGLRATVGTLRADPVGGR